MWIISITPLLSRAVINMDNRYHCPEEGGGLVYKGLRKKKSESVQKLPGAYVYVICLADSK